MAMAESGVYLEVKGQHTFELATDGSLLISGPRELTLEPELVSELSSFLNLFLARAIIRDAEQERAIQEE